MDYDKEAITTPYVTAFIREKTEQTDELLKGLEAYAKENRVPRVPTRFSLAMSPVMDPTVSSQWSSHPRGWKMMLMTSPMDWRIESVVASAPG